MKPAHFIFRCKLLVLVMLSTTGCAQLREIALDQKVEELNEHYESLNDCDRVELVRGFLAGGRRYDPFLQTHWPPNGTMLDMLSDLGGKTGISRDFFISCWTGWWYGPDELWLELVEPWRSVLGCDGGRVDRAGLLRWCDPLLAEALDSMLASPLLQTRRGELPRIEVVRGYLALPESDRIADIALGSPIDSSQSGVVNVTSFLMGDFSRTCWGLISDDPVPEYRVYFGYLDNDRMAVKAIPVVVGNEAIGPASGVADSAGVAFLLDRTPGTGIGWFGSAQRQRVTGGR